MTSFRDSVKDFLKKTERITKTDNLYLVKNGTRLFLTHGVAVTCGFIQYLLIARLLPQETYGQYKYLLSLFSLFSVATLTSMDSAVSRAVALGKEGALRIGFRWKLIGGGIASLITIGAAIYYALTHQSMLATALIAMACTAPFIYAANLYSAYFSGKKEFAIYSRINIGTTILSCIGMSAAFLVLRDPLTLFLVFLLTSGTNLIGYFLARREVRNNENDPKLLSYATHLSALDILTTLANNLDAILVFHFLGASALAVYAIGILAVDQMKGFLKIIQSLAFPKLAASNFETIRTSMLRKVLLFMLGTSLCVFAYILLAPAFFSIFFPRYIASVPYSQVYALSLIPLMPAGLLTTMFTAQGMRKEITLANTINYGLQILFVLIGSWLFGIWGAVLSRVISRTLMLLTSLFIFGQAKQSTTKST